MVGEQRGEGDEGPPGASGAELAEGVEEIGGEGVFVDRRPRRVQPVGPRAESRDGDGGVCGDSKQELE